MPRSSDRSAALIVRTSERGSAANQILVAAVAAFSEQGFGATTTRELARRVGLSPAGVYVHFDTKELVLYELTLLGHRDALATLRAARPRPEESADDSAAHLRAAVVAFARWHAQHRSLARVVQYEAAALDTQHRNEIATVRRAISAGMREAVLAAASAGSDVAAAELAVLSLCIDIARWFPAGRHHDAERLAADYAELAVRMVH